MVNVKGDLAHRKVSKRLHFSDANGAPLAEKEVHVKQTGHSFLFGCGAFEFLTYLEKKVITADNEYTTPALKETVKDSYDRLISPAIEREIRNELTEKAQDGAIDVFGKNLKQLLMQPPVAGQVVLG